MMRTPRTAPPNARVGGTVHSRRRRPLMFGIPLAIAALAALAGGCGADVDTPAKAGTPAPAPGTLTVTDPWVKAAASGMTAAFGTLTNNTDHEITVVSAASPSAKKVELHEVAMSGGAMVMRPKAGGFVIPAHGSHLLKPGGDHFMMMGLTAPVRPGDRVSLTLALAGGSTLPLTAVAKDFAGGREDYQPGGQASPSGGTSPGAAMHGGTA